MKNDRRGMKRREFRRITGSRLEHRHMVVEGFSGEAGLLYISQVAEPWIVRNSDGDGVVIADSGYSWLQLSPDQGGWWLTVMYDAEGKLKQYYFDITLENFISEDGEPGFTDLYLDIVMEPGGNWRLLDADELDRALETGSITREEHSLATGSAKKLIRRVDGNEAWWRKLCAGIRAELNMK
jgi:predicted RNA-binding protein associated with RNAse of E/G family